ncbi:Capsular polysaccharide synthesis enzyme Cap5H [Pectobacterium wasabiae CFBP 3304]|nr:Capsular polysaccharide synthesis enzyme Cap5H [Pectobacterium wasabiae CFBP 3304]
MGTFSYAVGYLPPELKVGRFCSIAQGVSIMGVSHPMNRFTTHPMTYDNDFVIKSGIKGCEEFDDKLPLPIIGHDVWIGGNVVLKGGITIGHGAVIGANSIVTKDVPPYAVVAGIPAKIIRFRFENDIIHKLLELEWWNYKPSDIPAHEKSIGEFIKAIETSVGSNEIKPHEYKKINLSEIFKSLC